MPAHPGHHDPADDDANLDELLMRASRALRRRAAAAFAEIEGYDLAPHDGRALRVIGHHGPTRLGVVADHLRIAPRSVTDVVDRLEERGLVERRPDPVDRRAMNVLLTHLGQDVLTKVNANRQAQARDFFGVLDPQEQQTLSDLLARLDPSEASR